MKNKKNITISDVASAAGVSKTTVSRYLNNRTDLMSEKTKNRIEKMIELLDYHPSELARSLKSKKTKTIGVVVPELRSPFYTSAISGIEDVLKKNGYSIVIMECENKLENEQSNIKEMLSRDVDGLIVDTVSNDNEYLVSLDIQKFPIVLLDRYIKNHKMDIACIDNEAMMIDLFDHFEKEGFNRFALFTQPWKEISARYERRKYFLKTIKKRYGYDASKDIYTVGIDYASFDEALDAFVETFKENDVPVIIGVNSVSTFSSFHAILKKDLKIPSDIGICGPDDWSWDANMAWPEITSTTITTNTFDTEYLGKKCAELLLEKINNPEKEIENFKLKTNLIIRESTTRKEK